jgi:hypothetical protein
MAKEKLFGILEAEATLLEPVSEQRYRLEGETGADLVGSWVTINGEVNGEVIRKAKIANVEKAKGKVTRAGTITATAANLPPEANGQGGYLYQEKKGRYFLLSSGPADQPVTGDFSQFVGQEVKAIGELGEVNYIMYNAKVSAK